MINYHETGKEIGGGGYLTSDNGDTILRILHEMMLQPLVCREQYFTFYNA